MNKLIVAAGLALGLVLTANQEASAWSKWSVNAGISINYEGGNNNSWAGLFRSGQVPGYPTDVPRVGLFGQGGGMPAYGAGFPIYGDYGHTPAPTTNEPPVNKSETKTTTQAIYYPNAYQSPSYNYPSTGSYGYPYGSYNYGYGYTQQVPSYWYGR